MGGDYTDLLYARPSLCEGIARIVDLGGTLDLYNESSDGAAADRAALASDWYAVGQDLRKALIIFAKERGWDDFNDLS